MRGSQQPNRLAKESSPYLLQHANNPVDWYPWGPEALEKSKTHDLPIILSIGYSACHWCHVMEKESFENEDIAQLMNASFVCIKVDREERPDVDQIYMDAVHAMGVQGGWPLNVFLTPDQEPFYGGTYFPPTQWHNLLQQITNAFANNRNRLEESAQNFTRAIVQSDARFAELKGQILSEQDLNAAYETIAGDFDTQLGGTLSAPKFPMPVIWEFCLHYFRFTKNPQALAQLNRTLSAMARGGIYDQIGGGFARYSVDEYWFAPHFEKMLYDNGQLVGLYSEAYRTNPDPLYKTVVEETISFVERDLVSPEGGFYSALDADSEGKEGKYYVWSHAEFSKTLGNDLVDFLEFFNVREAGNWEEGQNILHLTQKPEELGIDSPSGIERLKSAKVRLLAERSLRVPPGLDDKILSGWNAIMLKGLVDAYVVFGEQRYLEIALANADFLEQKMITKNGLLRNYKKGKATIPGYLEDLAWVALAFSSLYQATFNERWLNTAKGLLDQAFDQYYDKEDGFFFFTGSQSEKLIARKKEYFDNVIPGSNSVLAQALLEIGTLMDDPQYLESARMMISKMAKLARQNPGSMANWASLLTQTVEPNYEIAIVGPEAMNILRQLNSQIQAPAVYVGTTSQSELPLLRDKHPPDDQTLIYVCQNQTCQLPVSSVEEALQQIG